jgi:hypothetical protein
LFGVGVGSGGEFKGNGCEYSSDLWGRGDVDPFDGEYLVVEGAGEGERIL